MAPNGGAVAGDTLADGTGLDSHDASGAAWRSLFADKAVLFAFAYLTLVVSAALFPNYIAPFDPTVQNLREARVPPFTGGHLLGTDALGRDVLSRLTYGARITLLVGSAGVALAMAIGVTLGLIAGFSGGTKDTVIMRVVDAQMAFSSLLVTMMIVVILGASAATLVLVFGLSTWVLHARVVRSAALYMREIQFVEASRSTGASALQIILGHILPNLLPVICSMGILEAARLMVAEASLSFLGFGIQPPDVSWGLMVAEGRDYLEQSWWLVTFPGLAITLVVIAVNMVGTWLREMANPFQRQLVSRAKGR